VDFAGRAAALVRNGDKRKRFGDAAREYALTRPWATMLEPLYRAYAAVPAVLVAPSVGTQAVQSL
jgi:hypothetical protein